MKISLFDVRDILVGRHDLHDLIVPDASNGAILPIKNDTRAAELDPLTIGAQVPNGLFPHSTNKHGDIPARRIVRRPKPPDAVR